MITGQELADIRTRHEGHCRQFDRHTLSRADTAGILKDFRSLFDTVIFLLALHCAAEGNINDKDAFKAIIRACLPENYRSHPIKRENEMGGHVEGVYSEDDAEEWATADEEKRAKRPRETGDETSSIREIGPVTKRLHRSQTQYSDDSDECMQDQC